MRNFGDSFEVASNGEFLILAEHESEFNGPKDELIEENGYKRAFYPGFPILYFEDQQLGAKMFVDYVTDLFSTDLFCLSVNRKSLWAVDWVFNRQENPLSSVNLLEVENEEDPYADGKAFDYVLRHANTIEFLNIYVKLSENFKLADNLGPFQDLTIFEGYWITCNDLMKIDAAILDVQRSRLYIPDFSIFLRHWQSGGSPRLEKLDVSFETEIRDLGSFDEDLGIVETDEVRVYRYR
ncbi:hypothetical protein B9Z55_013088 [Caenorhabditis nigoni]|uniref:Sdz-33 F-box domain-containing protein n=1 Tax=Caenorhabditis nigoni TaxID=1611254 RepID=A0A2G5U073_9PELO|nr:hypothetical protein B9Z55_013088 [Caenorhabditis nigoni]